MFWLYQSFSPKPQRGGGGPQRGRRHQRPTLLCGCTDSCSTQPSPHSIRKQGRKNALSEWDVSFFAFWDFGLLLLHPPAHLDSLQSCGGGARIQRGREPSSVLTLRWWWWLRMSSIMQVNCSAAWLVGMGKRAQALPFLAAMEAFSSKPDGARQIAPIDKDHCLPVLDAMWRRRRLAVQSRVAHLLSSCMCSLIRSE